MPKLLDQVRYIIRLKHYSIRTEQAYIQWIKRFIIFLYEAVLKKPLNRLDHIQHAKRESRLPVVFTSQETQAVLAQLDGQLWLMSSLMYGAGFRLIECIRLRVKDPDFTMKQIIVRDGKGGKDRVTALEASYDIRTIQELPGHKDVRTTMIYTHVLNRGGKSVRSPSDRR